MLVQKKIIPLIRPFAVESGYVFTQPEVAYEEYGNASGPVILLCHGGLSSCHAAGKYAETDAQPGWWDGLVGPGKPFDTNRFRILAMNALGSSFGSTGPTSIDPATGKRFGPTFPELTLRDQVRFIKAFLDHMDIRRVHIMAGPSMGSLHTLQMAAMCPDMVSAAVAVATAGRMTASGMAMHHFIANALREDPGFDGGWYVPGKPLYGMRVVWQNIRIYYGSEKIFQQMCFDPIAHGAGAQKKRSDAVRSFLTLGMEAALASFDPNAMIASVEAINTHDLGEGFATYEEGVRQIQCPVLLLNIDTDQEFPPHCAQELATILNEQRPHQARVALIKSPWGHLGCVLEPIQLGQHIMTWMQEHQL